jgi:NAD(P)-dependent dehydrogenase (short-subunit alcohol dehydrogenase family)
LGRLGPDPRGGLTRLFGGDAGAGRPSRGKGHIPFGRQATAWEIAHAALFFMSDESVYVTAQTLAVDSGLSGL